jgi:soluble lytic murein transglycosylase-like protein
MTGQGSAKRRAAVIAAIIAGSILLGVLVDFAWGKIEEATHPKTYSAYVRQYSYEFNVPESIVYAVIKVESDFDPYAESDVGARGLMQMMQRHMMYCYVFRQVKSSVMKIVCAMKAASIM